MGDTQKAKLILDEKTYELPIVVGTEGEKAIDITKLRAQTGYITLDEGFANKQNYIYRRRKRQADVPRNTD